MKKKVLSLVLVLTLSFMFVPTASASSTAAGRSASIVTLSGSGVFPRLFTASGVITDEMPSNNFINEARAAGNPLAIVNGAYFNAYYDTSAARSFPGNCPNAWNTLIYDGKILRSGGGVSRVHVRWEMADRFDQA